MGDTRPPLEYLVSCSASALESMELARLNRASNLRKEIRQILEEWINSEVDARLARWILEFRRTQQFGPPDRSTHPGGAVPPQQFAISFPPSLNEWVRTAANENHPAECAQQGLACDPSPSASTDFPTDMGKIANVGVSRRVRRCAAAQPIDDPRAASDPIDTSAPRPPLAAISRAVEVHTLERIARYQVPKLPGSSPNAANKHHLARMQARPKADSPSRHSLLPGRVRWLYSEKHVLLSFPRTLRTGPSSASRSGASAALGLIETTRTFLRRGISVPGSRATPVSAPVRQVFSGLLSGF
jgi:hypothetical protein